MLGCGAKLTSLLSAISSPSSRRDRHYFPINCSSLPSPGNLRELAMPHFTQTLHVLCHKFLTLGTKTRPKWGLGPYIRHLWADQGPARSAPKFCPSREANVAGWPEQSATHSWGIWICYSERGIGRDQRSIEEAVGRSLAQILRGNWPEAVGTMETETLLSEHEWRVGGMGVTVLDLTLPVLLS